MSILRVVAFGLFVIIMKWQFPEVVWSFERMCIGLFDALRVIFYSAATLHPPIPIPL